MADIKRIDFDINSITPSIKPLHPGDKAEVTFQVVNESDYPVRAEVIILPLDGPNDVEGMKVPPENWAGWLTLVEPPEYNYQLDSQCFYKVQIQVPQGADANPGNYRFMLMLTGLDDPDHTCINSLPVSFAVEIPPINSRPFVIGGIALVALLLIAGLVILIRMPKPIGLTPTLKGPPDPVTVGQPAVFTLEMTNKLSTPAKGVVLDYNFSNDTYKDRVIRAWAKVDMGGPAVSHCASVEKHLRCVFPEITIDQKVTVSLFILPGPLAAKPIEPSRDPKFGVLNLYWKGSPDSIRSFDLTVKNVNQASDILAAVVPSTDVATVGLPVKISLFAWLTTEPLTPADEVIFTLPGGMRFHKYPKEKCSQNDRNNYFLLTCDPKSTDPLELELIPLQESEGHDFSLQVSGGGKTETIVYHDLLPAKNNQLILNGRDEWVQLGFIGMAETTAEPTQAITPSPGSTQATSSKSTNTPTATFTPTATNTPEPTGTPEQKATHFAAATDKPTEAVEQQKLTMPRQFTVAMWVNPLSTEDGQAFLGAHLHTADNTKVENLFLVGFYNGSIEINLMGENHDLCTQKPTTPFHLMVVVDQPSGKDPMVKAYINGEVQNWKVSGDPDEVPCVELPTFMVYNVPIKDEAGQPFNWVIGQDWDTDGSSFIQSDYFHGSISDLRLWQTAQSEGVIKETYLLPPFLGEQDLLGWWPLAPTGASYSGEPVDCRLAKAGQVTGQASAALAAACVLPDAGPNGYDGARSGGAWESAGTGFGNALAFDGHSAAYQPTVQFAGFGKPNASATIDRLAARGTATPCPTIIPTSAAKGAGLAPTATIVPKPGNTPFGSPTATPVPVTCNDPSDGDKACANSVPVTISAWVWAGAMPYQKQLILADVFDSVKKTRVNVITGVMEYASVNIVGMLIDQDGHVTAFFNQIDKSGNQWLTWKSTKDEKPLPWGRWVHYAMVFYMDPDINGLAKIGQPLQLYRDAEKVKGTQAEGNILEGFPLLPSGFYLGGFPQGKGDPLAAFTGKIDEVRMWNRALAPTDEKSYHSADLDLWRRWPGVSFDEYVYWSFDDALTVGLGGTCPAGIAYDYKSNLVVQGPVWVINDLRVDSNGGVIR